MWIREGTFIWAVLKKRQKCGIVEQGYVSGNRVRNQQSQTFKLTGLSVHEMTKVLAGLKREVG